MEDAYGLHELAGGDYDLPASVQALAWERRNFDDFMVLSESDGVLPILVSQAGLGSPDNVNDPDVRLALARACHYARMTVSRVVDTWRKVSAIIEQVADSGDAVFVNGYDAVPHDLDHLEDAVHLSDAGSECLAEEIARVLLQDPRFMRLVERVELEASGSND